MLYSHSWGIHTLIQQRPVIYLTVPERVQRGWDYLRSLEFRLRIPRPEHDLADLEVQEAWKKNCVREPNEFNISIH
ncbi:winged helix-turn-helix domain-containing protein [Microcoleus vaginatus]|uniref:winged helix-turn-helix domain-containing protein n=1 Tax=Microcoleus vaginatus TaxID=119532 RepID=UPI00168567CB|nr:winged helix-turn-helix domain-containing protein [Microcoleus sp. FACHB-45]